MSTETTASNCANCGTELLGPHCYACGQPVKGMVRHLSSIVGDLFDTLLALDSRIVRTLGPLLLRPGFLSGEYFAGRRVRYVSPVRLFIFLCLTSFFVAQVSSDWSDFNVNESDISSATTAEEVIQQRDEALAGLAEAREASKAVPGALSGLKVAERKIRREAELRLAELSGEEAPAASRDEENCVTGAADECRNPENDPIHIDAFPRVVNDWLTTLEVRIEKNMGIMEEDPDRFKKAFFGAIPTALLTMLPFFALLLWLLYPLKRRLYMEHLIVALHSHAFLCLALLLFVLSLDIRQWLEAYFLGKLLPAVAATLLLLWMPLYLLLMQKRVYAQGWVMTLFKYSVLGSIYSLLLVFILTFVLLTSLAWM